MLKYSRQEGVRSAYRPLTTKISFRFVNFSYFRTKFLSRVVKVPVYTKDWALVGKCNCFALVQRSTNQIQASSKHWPIKTQSHCHVSHPLIGQIKNYQSITNQLPINYQSITRCRSCYLSRPWARILDLTSVELLLPILRWTLIRLPITLASHVSTVTSLPLLLRFYTIILQVDGIHHCMLNFHQVYVNYMSMIYILYQPLIN